MHKISVYIYLNIVVIKYIRKKPMPLKEKRKRKKKITQLYQKYKNSKRENYVTINLVEKKMKFLFNHLVR